MLDLFLEAFAAPFESLGDFFDAGGFVTKWIFVTAVILWGLALERFWYFLRIHPGERARVAQEWAARRDHRSWEARMIRLAMLSQIREAMAAPLPMIKVMVPLCPLLGLLGTVGGMLEVFDAMSASGSADTRAMAYGISHAMIATMSGLMVSLNALLFTGYFQTVVRRESEHLADVLVAA